MNYNEPADIRITLHGDSGFTTDDAEALTQNLRSHFQPRFRVGNSGVVHFTIPPAHPRRQTYSSN